MKKQCDYHKFCGDQCQAEAHYGQPDFPISKEYPGTDEWIRTLRWCEKHKHETDVLVVEKCEHVFSPVDDSHSECTKCGIIEGP